MTKARKAPSKRWNVRDIINQVGANTHRDFGGFYSEEQVDRVKQLVVQVTHGYTVYDDGEEVPGIGDAIRDITANMLIDCMEYDEDSSYEDPIWEDRAIHIMLTVMEMFTNEMWTKSGIDWKPLLDQRQKEWEEVVNKSKQ